MLNEGFSRKRLRGRLQCFASEMGKTGAEIVSPILDERKDGSIRVTIAPRKILLSGIGSYKQIFRMLSKYKKVRIDKDAPWEDVTKLKYIEELTKILDV